MNHYLNAVNGMKAASGLASAVAPRAEDNHQHMLGMITQQIVNCHDAFQVAFGIKAPSESLQEDLDVARRDGQSNMNASQLLDEFVSIQIERAIASLSFISAYYFDANNDRAVAIANAIEEMRAWLLSAQKAVDYLAIHMPDGRGVSIAA